MSETVIGIDLGTTHSLVCLMEQGSPKILANELGQELTPSIVAVGKDGVMLVGQPAKERILSDASSGKACFKRDMGTDVKYLLGKKDWNPIECSALVLREMKRIAEAYLEEKVVSAVISVPAYFRDAQRQATIEAAELVGLKVERIINEPTAAALAFGYKHTEKEANILVFDLGGGTFDVTMLEVFDGVVEVKASAGESHLGGEDYTDLLYKGLVSKYNLSIPVEESPKWRERVEKAKCQLVDVESVDCQIQGNKVEVSRADLALAAKDLNTRVRGIIRKCIFDAGLTPEQVDDVLLVGGASRMYLVQEIIESILPEKVNTGIDPDRAIAIGAGVQAALIEQDEAVDDIVLTDVSPHTMGVEVAKERNGIQEPGFFSPIIDRNTTLPVSRSDEFSSFYPEQDKVELKVFQGESRMTKDNHQVGVLNIKGLKHTNQKDPKAGAFEVRFTYDMNGLLEVDVKILLTEKTFTQVFEQRPGALSKKEMNEALAKLRPLKIHPRETLPNRNRIERADRLYENLSGGDRERLTQLIDHFEHVLVQQDQKSIGEVGVYLDDFLNHFEEKF